MKKSCDDGYPSCRYAEATGRWCPSECRASMESELSDLLAQRDDVRVKQMERFHSGSATRARTTTSNAAADRFNERIVFLRGELKKLSGEQCEWEFVVLSDGREAAKPGCKMFRHFYRDAASGSCPLCSLPIVVKQDSAQTKGEQS